LVRRNALQLSHDRFRTDSERLASAVDLALEKTAAERREREEKERLEVERRETEAKERLEAERRQKEEQERQEAEQRERERPEAERREREQKERLEHEPQAQPPRPVAALAPVAPSTFPAKPEADKPSTETPKVVYPLPPKPTEPEREKPPPSSSGGTGGKRPSKQVIAFLAIAAVLVVGALIYNLNSLGIVLALFLLVVEALIYLAIRAFHSRAPVSVIPSPSISATPTKEELARRALENATKDHPWVNSLGMTFVPVAGTQVLSASGIRVYRTLKHS
jgi:hypothetical protein